MSDSYAGGFLDGWAAAAETLRTRFDLIPRDATAGPRINGERLGGPIGHSDPPEGKPWLVGPQGPPRRLQWAEADSRGEAYIPAGRIRRLTEANLAALADCDPCTVHLIIGGACVYCGTEMR